ncbi:hypothetical protein AB0D74_39705 [Streptomyces sp. NPDC048278]
MVEAGRRKLVGGPGDVVTDVALDISGSR